MISKEQRDRMVKEIVDQWAIEEAKYKALGNVVREYLDKYISSTEVLPSIACRVKSVLSMIKTALKKDKEYSTINDKLGFRIVCHFKSELPAIKAFIEASFEVISFERKADKLEFDELGYVSEHYEVKLKPSIPEFSCHPELLPLIFEIQSRTICQHAWADVEHTLAYKQEVDLDKQVKRRVFRLSSLLEVCDDEFDSVNSHLLLLPESRAFAILRTVEGKFFKYVRRSYDRDIAFTTINTLLNGFKSYRYFGEIQNQLRDFVAAKENIIEGVFQANEAVFDSNIFISQPEIIFVWFLTEKYPHDLVKVWGSVFDIEDLKEIAIMWGISLPIAE